MFLVDVVYKEKNVQWNDIASHEAVTPGNAVNNTTSSAERHLHRNCRENMQLAGTLFYNRVSTSISGKIP